MRRSVALLVTVLMTAMTVVVTAGPALSITAVSGTVTDELTGVELEDICVELYTSADDTTVQDSVLTSDVGFYEFTGLAEDDYKLFFYEPDDTANCGTTSEAGTPGWTSEWNGGAADHASAANATGTEDAALTGTGSLAGTVFDDDGMTALTCQVDVRLFESVSESVVATDDTSGDGLYSFSGLAPGFTYAIHFDPGSGGFCNGKAGEWSGGGHAVGSGDGSLDTFIAEALVADPITVTAEEAITGKDVTLEDGASITGTAVGEISGAAIEGVSVRLYAGGDPTGGDFLSVLTDVSGVFTFAGLANDPSGYNIQFESNLGWEGEWYDDSTTGQAGRAVIAVTPATATDLGDVDRHGRGNLEGLVQDSLTSDPIDGATVTLYELGTSTVAGSAATGVDGAFVLDDVDDGTYDLEITAPSYETLAIDGFVLNATVEDQIDRQDLGTQELDPSPGSISGTVTDVDTTDPIEGATVTLYDDGGTTVLDSATTDAGGDYTLDGITPGTYDLKFSAAGYVTEWFDDQASAAAGTIAVGYGEAVVADGALLAASGSISGVVTDDDTGEPIEGVLVKLWDGGGTTLLDETVTNDAGEYTFDVAPGTYDVEFCHDDYIKEWYGDADSASGAITVGNGEDVTVNEGLASNAGSVSGTISDASVTLQSAHGVAGVRVEVIDGDGDVVASAVTDADGAYTVEDVSPGSYRVLANTGPAEAPVGYFQKWYVDSPLFLDEAATTVVVGTAQDVTGVDIALQPLFTDVPTASIFYGNILWLQQSGITAGCTLTEYCPRDSVTRAQMATFLVRALDLPATSTDYFTDDDGNTHEDNINALREAGITFGCTATEYCPNDSVTRAQMASFLVRALELDATTVDYFTDDDGSTHEDNINALREAEVTLGCTATEYCPGDDVRRDQMAAFLNRALDEEAA